MNTTTKEDSVSTREPLRIRDDSFAHVAVAPFDLVTDPRLSATDLGVYLRCRWLFYICGSSGDVNWLINELRMPEAESHDSVRRLVELGYLDWVSDREHEQQSAYEASRGVRSAIEAAVDDLTPAERATVARLADLGDQRLERASAELYGEKMREQ